MHSTITIENEILYKEAVGPESPTESPEIGDDLRRKKLEEMARNLASPASRARRTYSDEQKQLIKEFQEFFRDFDSYLPYEQPELKALGEKIMGHVTEVFKSTKEVADDAIERNMDGKKLTRDEAIKEITGSEQIILESQYFKKLGSKKLSEKDIYKMATPKEVMNSISVLFRGELEKVINIHEVKKASSTIFKKASSNSAMKNIAHDELFELALTHQILSLNGLNKEAKRLDEFIEKIALWDAAKRWGAEAWEGTKKVVGTALEYAGKAVVTVAEGVASGVKWVAKIAMKGLRHLVRMIPALGILFSLPFFIKNAIEAWKNGKDIMSSDKYDFEKYGFGRWKSITPAGASHVISTFNSATDEYIRSPKDLKEIILIFRTIGSFWIDCLFAISNLVMTILDLIQIIGLFFPGPGWLLALGGVGADFLFNAGIISIEMSSEYFKDITWEAEENKMLTKVRSEVTKIISEGTVQEQAAPKIRLAASPDYNLNLYPKVSLA